MYVCVRIGVNVKAKTMRRKIYDKLVEWKNKSGRKPLIVNGVRQVG